MAARAWERGVPVMEVDSMAVVIIGYPKASFETQSSRRTQRFFIKCKPETQSSKRI
jgi:hypothetical protein